MELRVSCFSNIICISIFLIIFNDVLGQNDEKCFSEYETESSYKTENETEICISNGQTLRTEKVNRGIHVYAVPRDLTICPILRMAILKNGHDTYISFDYVIYVCTSGLIPNFTDVLYMDTAKVPLAQFTSCSCTVTFAEEGQHSIRLDYKHDSDQRHSLVIDGFNTNFSQPDVSKNVVVTKENTVHFLVNSTSNKPLRACLRVSLIKDSISGILFQASCSPAGTVNEPQSSTTGERTTKTSHQEDSTLSGSTSVPIQDTTGYSSSGGISGSTSLPIRESTGDSSSGGNSGIVIGAAVGGVVGLIIILVIITVIIVKRKRKHKTEEEEEDYYITENATYGGVTKQQSQEPIENYDEITPDKLKRKSVIYSVVDKGNVRNKNGGVVKQQTVEEDDYNHLNSLPKSVVTGNIYSSIGRRGSQPTSNIYNSVSASQKGLSCNDNIYNSREES